LAFSRAAFFFIIIEFFADNQQWKFQSAKKEIHGQPKCLLRNEVGVSRPRPEAADNKAPLKVLSDQGPETFGLPDLAFSRAAFFFIIIEFFADNQQWKFQSAKATKLGCRDQDQRPLTTKPRSRSSAENWSL
jgi:steroid 5-alpha reductase family enzyme